MHKVAVLESDRTNMASSKKRIFGESFPQTNGDLISNNEQMSRIGGPTLLTSGQFADCTVRMELDEVQKADLGRKHARIDRRPLDPPPVIHLKIFRVQPASSGKEIETEVDYNDIQALGFICTLDLFPVPDSFAPSQANPSRAGKASSATSHVRRLENISRGHTAQKSRQAGSSVWQSGMSPSQSEKAVHVLENYTILESSKLTEALAGATFVQAVKLEYQGKTAILFTFSDLAVKIAGVFILRYRVFDLFSRAGTNDEDATITAETYGGPFRVYSTKNFPGLPPSTTLTKNLARWGVRLNIRETERKRKKKADGDASP